MPAPEPRPPVERYLILPAIDDAVAAGQALAVALAQHQPSSVLLAFASDDPVTIGDLLTPLQVNLQGQGIACVLAGDPTLAVALDCDGVQVLMDPNTEKTTLGISVKQARQQLGPDRILGVHCGESRHAAMLAAEQGADYVVFGPCADATSEARAELAWWQVMMELPCVADQADDEAMVEALYRQGADFVMIAVNK